MIQLSKAMAKDAQRQAGIELMVSWPEALGPAPTDLGLNQECDANVREELFARQLVQDACAKHALRVLGVSIACARPLGSQYNEPAIYLAIRLIGSRWRHPIGQPIVRWP